MNILNKDFNLLYLFKVLYEEQNLSKAAERMALSQPTLSHKLNKLRREFDDELFVRAARGLTPTPIAHQTAPAIAATVANIELLYQDIAQENFLAREDTIYLHTTDLIEQLLMPRLLVQVSEQAPGLKIVSLNTLGKFPKQALEKGSCDIAIAGFYQDLPESFYQQALREESFTVLARKAHPRINNNMDVDDYLANSHIVTTLSGDLSGVVDKHLARQGQTRKVVGGLSSFLAPPQVVRQSDFLLTCLSSIAVDATEQYDDLQRYPCPIDLPKVQICQFWHQRTHG